MTPKAQPGERVVLKVAGGSQVNGVAGAIAKYVGERARIEILAIGAGAVNQMLKAMCIARGMVAQTGVDLSFTCGFSDERIGEDHKTAIRIYVKHGVA